MKTIIDEHKCSKYLFANEKIVTVKAECIEVGNPVEFMIGDMNSGNSTLIEGVTAPDGWMGCKYNYVNDAWELCPDWVDPRLKEDAV